MKNSTKRTRWIVFCVFISLSLFFTGAPMASQAGNSAPVKKMEMHVDKAIRFSKVLDLLTDISERIPKALDAHVTRIVIDPGTMWISGKTDSFKTVHNIKIGLKPSKYFSAVVISSAELDRTGKQVQFEIKLQRTR